MFNGRVSDWAGEAAFLRFDKATIDSLTIPRQAEEFFRSISASENVDLLMRNNYFLQSAQVKIVHGPGRRPTSNQIFLTFAGPMRRCSPLSRRATIYG